MEEGPEISRRELLRIVIVGAGLAGLSCAYRLDQRGLACSVYEANPERIGGRCWTLRAWASGQTAEHGGEFIDSRHRRLRALAKRFGLELTDLYAVPNPGTPRLWLNGELRRRSELSAPTRPPTTPLPRTFDELSVKDWLDENLPGGSAGLWGQYIWAEMANRQPGLPGRRGGERRTLRGRGPGRGSIDLQRRAILV